MATRAVLARFLSRNACHGNTGRNLVLPRVTLRPRRRPYPRRRPVRRCYPPERGRVKKIRLRSATQLAKFIEWPTSTRWPSACGWRLVDGGGRSRDRRRSVDCPGAYLVLARGDAAALAGCAPSRTTNTPACSWATRRAPWRSGRPAPAADDRRWTRWRGARHHAGHARRRQPGARSIWQRRHGLRLHNAWTAAHGKGCPAPAAASPPPTVTPEPGASPVPTSTPPASSPR